tara:strand:- start:299 stop:985 length:687 start_codon:yes stop_codon:yes gene_type:complete
MNFTHIRKIVLLYLSSIIFYFLYKYLPDGSIKTLSYIAMFGFGINSFMVYYEYSDKFFLSLPTNLNKILFLSISCSIIPLLSIYFLLLESFGFIAAFNAIHINYIMISIVFLVFFTSTNLHSINQLNSWINNIIIFSFIATMYSYFDVDDGCYRTGGDGLFDAGDEICDSEYIDQKDKFFSLNSNKFNQEMYIALYFYEILLTCYFSVIVSAILRKIFSFFRKIISKF